MHSTTNGAQFRPNYASIAFPRFLTFSQDWANSHQSVFLVLLARILYQSLISPELNFVAFVCAEPSNIPILVLAWCWSWQSARMYYFSSFLASKTAGDRLWQRKKKGVTQKHREKAENFGSEPSSCLMLSLLRLCSDETERKTLCTARSGRCWSSFDGRPLGVVGFLVIDLVVRRGKNRFPAGSTFLSNKATGRLVWQLSCFLR